MKWIEYLGPLKYATYFLSFGIAAAGQWLFHFTRPHPEDPSRRQPTSVGNVAFALAMLTFVLTTTAMIGDDRAKRQKAAQADAEAAAARATMKEINDSLQQSNKELAETRKELKEAHAAILESAKSIREYAAQEPEPPTAVPLSPPKFRVPSTPALVQAKQLPCPGAKIFVNSGYDGNPAGHLFATSASQYAGPEGACANDATALVKRSALLWGFPLGFTCDNLPGKPEPWVGCVAPGGLSVTAR